jgi:hypothetical protein
MLSSLASVDVRGVKGPGWSCAEVGRDWKRQQCSGTAMVAEDRTAEHSRSASVECSYREVQRLSAWCEIHILCRSLF